MKARIILYKTDGPGAGGKYPIKLIIEHQKKRKRKTIGYSLESEWDFSKEIPKKNHAQYFDLYAEISNMRIVAESLKFQNCNDVNKALLLFFETREPERFDFYSWADVREEYMRSQNRNGNADAYKNAIVQFKNFMPELYWDEINVAFIENFKVYKKMDGVKNRTMRAYIAAFKAIYRSGVKLKSLPNNDPFFGVFDDLKISKRRVKNIYLLKKDIKLLENAVLSRVACQRAIDLVLLQYYLGGCDFIELCYIKKADIRHGRVWFERKKRGDLGFRFDVKIFDKAKVLMDKYSVPNSEYLFPWAYENETKYKSFRRMQNRLIEDAFKILKIKTMPLNEKFTTKSVRHTFQTIGKFEYVIEDVIREIVGHERSDMDTVYKDKYPEHIRDAGHWKIIDTSGV